MNENKSRYEMAVKEVPQLKAMTLRFVTNTQNVAKDFFVNYGVVGDRLTAGGAAPEEFFSLHHGETFDPERMDMEVCISVKDLVEDGDSVTGRTLPGGTFAYVTHKGPYSGTVDAIAELTRMMGERGLIPCGPLREVYLNDPDNIPPEELLTEVMFQVRE
jgi:effector-binding domain-containing protein